MPALTLEHSLSPQPQPERQPLMGHDDPNASIAGKRLGALGALLLLLPLGLSACSTDNKLRAQAAEIQSITNQIESRAYRCAPRELALARSNTEFGLYELEQGNFVRAQKHLVEAELNAKKADSMSDFDECRDQQVAINVETTRKTDIVEAKPTPKDQDGDGLLDEEDQCPKEPEDFDSYKDKDGCPDPDNDGDQIADESDICPDVPEDKDGFEDNDGCPEFDNDGDGIADLNDQCKNKAEDFDGFQDDDGCPDIDNDEDQIIDVLDQCPERAEDYDNDQDNDGCPEERKLLKFEGDQIKLNEQVFFKFNKSTIMPASYPLLDEVAQVLRENPNIHIRIEGHTDDKGSNKSNLKLSKNRAASVRKYLEDKGIDPSRMESEGYGEERPIEDNKTDAGRAANRRVEIHITKK